MELDHLSLNELQGLRARVDQEMEKRRAQVKKEGLDKIKSIAAEYGLSAEELKLISGSKNTTKRGTVAPKYRDPNNRENTWTGRGRQPKWVEAFLNGGGRLEQITI